MHFFDGAQPDWKDVCHPNLKARPAVHKVVQEFSNRDLEDRSVLLRIAGATGDGKSTVLMQAAVTLLKDGVFETLYWRNRPDARLTPDVIEAMQARQSQFLIVSDEAECLLSDIDEFARTKLHEEDVFVHFLLASRDVDWNAERDRLRWKFSVSSRLEPSFRVLTPVNLRTVEPADARVLAENWINCSSSRPVLIRGKSVQEIAKNVLDASSASGGRQAFMGGVISVRFDSESLRSRLASLVAKLDTIYPELPKITLADFLVVLAAVDVSEIEGVPRDVVAQFLGILESELRPKVEVPMKREFFLGSSSSEFFSRHPMISKALLELALDDESDLRVETSLDKFLHDIGAMGEQFGFRDGFGRLLDLGHRLMRSGLSHDLIGPLALQLCRTACNVSHRHMGAWVALSHTLRTLKKPAQALTEVWEVRAALLDDPSAWVESQHTRSAWGELATALSAAGHWATAYWAAQVSLSDRPRSRLTPANITRALHLLAYNAKLIYENVGEFDGTVDLLAEVEALTCAPRSPFLGEYLYPKQYLHDLNVEARTFGGIDALVAAIQRVAASMPAPITALQWCSGLSRPEDNSLSPLIEQVRRYEHLVR
ncbi:hypothetical protein JOD54_000622 [Actinokineospora baliensis]|uniref:P-loop NTPase n=1 Tax=Actinokineospora baliensis TaxID=547056 RepID=UPI00195B7CC1|nr:hypothetical protein [Actinokineospora baliensis]MBM7770418.1 hypothetical protein [Actinokineospora baliensis]